MNKISKQLVKIAKIIYSFDKNKISQEINAEKVLYPTLALLLKGEINTTFIDNLELREMQETKKWVQQFTNFCNSTIKTIPEELRKQCSNITSDQIKKIITQNSRKKQGKSEKLQKVTNQLRSLFSSLVSILKSLPEETEIDFSSWK